MIKELLDRYKKNKQEIGLVEKQINRLNERLENVPDVSGKVTKSSDDFPYIEEHITVLMKEPKESTIIKGKIKEKEKRKQKLLDEITEVEQFIDALPEGVERQIMEMVYLEGMNQTDVAYTLGYTQGRISQIISDLVKD